MSKNEIMGCFSFDLNDIINGKHKKPFWVNVYGTLGSNNPEISNIMNTYSELGSEWMGRI